MENETLLANFFFFEILRPSLQDNGSEEVGYRNNTEVPAVL